MYGDWERGLRGWRKRVRGMGELERAKRTSVSVVEYSYSHSESESRGRGRLGNLAAIGDCKGKRVRVVDVILRTLTWPGLSRMSQRGCLDAEYWVLWSILNRRPV